VYPDARIIRTHRDPLKTIPSSLSLLGTLKWMRCEQVDMAGLSRMIPRGLARAHDLEAHGRDGGALPEERFVDVQYADLHTDPIRAVASIYDRLGWTLTDRTRQAMTDHLARRPAAARGVHRYSLGEFGLDAERERARFRSYRERFRVPDEA
jgi:hypothetical protein